MTDTPLSPEALAESAIEAAVSAMKYHAEGVPIGAIHENVWRAMARAALLSHIAATGGGGWRTIPNTAVDVLREIASIKTVGSRVAREDNDWLELRGFALEGAKHYLRSDIIDKARDAIALIDATAGEASAPAAPSTPTQDAFVWRDGDDGYGGAESKLYLFGQAFVSWVSEGFEHGYDAHFVVGQVFSSADGLVLGNRATLAEAKALCEQNVRKVFQMDKGKTDG